MKQITDRPNLYDLLYCEVTEDIRMYIELLKNAKSILELGAGTGRITIPLAKEGHYIEAVDLSKDMLTKLKKIISTDKNIQSNIHPVLNNMCGYQSEKQFDAIIIPLTSFNYLMTDKEQYQCLLTIKNNLKEEGFAVIELLSKNTFLDTNQSEDFTYIKRIYESENSYYDYYRITKLDLESRKIEQRRLFKYYIDNIYISEEELEWKNRFVTIEDFIELATKADLMIDNIYGNCQLEPYHENSEDLFIKVRRKKHE